MRTLARPIGLGLAARGDVDDVVRWARAAARRRARFDLDPRLVLRARRDQLRQRSPRALGRRWRRRRRRLPGRARGRQPVHPPPGRPGDDRLGARRDPARPHRHGPRDRAAAAAQADGHPVRARGRRCRRVRRRSTSSGRCGPASGSRRRRRACRRSSRCSRRPTGSRWSSPPTARSSSRWPARRPTATSPDRPSRSRRCAGSSSGSGRRPWRPVATRTRSRPPATCCRSSTRRGARRSTGRSASRSSST